MIYSVLECGRMGYPRSHAIAQRNRENVTQQGDKTETASVLGAAPADMAAATNGPVAALDGTQADAPATEPVSAPADAPEAEPSGSSETDPAGTPAAAPEAGATRRKRRIIVGTALMALFAALIVLFFSVFLTPRFYDDTRFSVGEMHNQPENTVEVAVLGASSLYRSVSPDRLFEQQGIAAFNCGSANQPTMSSYYLLKELLKTQKGSLKTIVLDAAPLAKHQVDEEGWAAAAVKVYAGLPPSPESVAYLYDMSQAYESVNFFEYLIPVFKFHSLWNKLVEEDFTKLEGTESLLYLHGQIVNDRSFLSNRNLGHAGRYKPNRNDAITPKIDAKADADKDAKVETNVQFFHKIVELCAEEGLDLMLLKSPAVTWDNAAHDSVAKIAEDAGVPFLDMSMKSIREECDLTYDDDYSDGAHVNLGGSLKVSDYLASYLKSHYDLGDYRDDSRYSFMNSDLAAFKAQVEDADLLACESLEEYLKLLDKDRYTVFAVTKGDAAKDLSDEARSQFANLGLEAFQTLGRNVSCIGVLNGGKMFWQRTQQNGTSLHMNAYYKNGVIKTMRQTMQPGSYVDYPVYLESNAVGYDPQGLIQYMREDMSKNVKGINFVVYDDATGNHIDTSAFDTTVDSARVYAPNPEN